MAEFSAGDASILRHKRLFRDLEAARARHGISWISGPSGAGKTTLIATYVAERALRCVWRTLDPADRDVGTFFHSLARAASRLDALPRAPSAESGELLQWVPDARDRSSTYARSLFLRLAERLGNSGLIVLDRVEELADAPVLEEALRAAEASLPRGVSVFVVGRDPPASTLRDLSLRGALLHVSESALAFTADELAEAARHRFGSFPGLGKAVAAVHAETGGWASAVARRLMDLKRPPRASARAEGAEAVRLACLDEFAGSDERRFLTAMSLLPYLTDGIARELGGASASSMVRRLELHGYLVRLPSTDGRYEIRPELAADFAMHHAEHGTDSSRALGRSLVETLRVQGHLDAAVHVLQRIGDAPGLASLLREQAPVLHTRHRSGTLRAWLAWLADRMPDLDPWLVYSRAAAELPDAPARALGLAERAYKEFIAAGELRGGALAWALAVEAVLAAQLHLSALDGWLIELDRFADAAGDDEARRDARAHLAASAVMALILRSPSDARLEHLVEQGWSALRTTAREERRMALAAALLRYHEWFGPLPRVELLVDAVRHDATSSASQPEFEIWRWHARAIAQRAAGARAESIAAANEGLALSAVTGVRRYDAALRLDAAAALLLGGDARQLPSALNSARRDLDASGPWERDVYNYLASWEAFVRGDIAAARERALECAAVARGVGSAFGERLGTLALAAVALDRDAPPAADAVENFEVARGAALGPEQSAFGFAAGLVDAQRALWGRQAEPSASAAALRSALTRGRSSGFRTLPPLPLRPRTAARLLSEALEHDVEPEYAKALLHEHDLIHDPPSRDLERWPWPVRVLAFGRFQLLVQGEPLRFMAKAQRRPIDLLKAMIALGGRDVSEEELADALWPDAEADAAERTLAITLHRLRILLKDENAVERRARTLTLSERHVWVDASAFERRLSELGGTRGQARRAALERALALYPAPFLAGDALPCAAVMRERLRSKFLQRMLELARMTEESEGAMAAEAIFLRAIEAEPLVERLYLELMRVQASVGRSSDSEATYRRCREVLRNELGTAPSAELEAARRSACPPSSAVSSTRPSVTLDHPTERVSSAGRRHR